MEVSILIIAHKKSDFLKKAIESALNQKFIGEYEVVLCSDGNKDLLKYAEEYKIKFVISNENGNKGCSFNINNGVKNCDGKYIKLLPYDDWLDENCIQKLYNKIKEENSSLVYANAYDVKNENKVINKSKPIQTITDLVINNVIHGGTTLFSKEDFLNVGGFDPSLKYAEEYDFHLKLLYNGKKLSYLDDFVFYYRRHKDQKGSSSLTITQKNEKNLLVEKIRGRYSKTLRVGGLATIESRKNVLNQTVNSIINQLDKLYIYQNGYKDFSLFKDNPKIEIISSINTGLDMGDAGKFYMVSKVKNAFYFSIDDDIIYPKDYVNNLVESLNKYDKQVIVTHHGRNLKQNPKSYYLDVLESFRCLDLVSEERIVTFGGTGVMGFHTNLVDKLNFEYFRSPNMADIWVGKYAKENKIPILVLPHKKDWIRTSLSLNEPNTIHRKYQFNHEVQNRVVSEINGLKKIKTVFLTCTWKRQDVTKIFIDKLLDVQKKLSPILDFENLVVDSENSNLSLFKGDDNFKYYNFQNTPVSNKWNFGAQQLKNSNFDYSIMVGSDDIIDQTLLLNYFFEMRKNIDMIGILDMYIYNLKEKKLFYWGGYTKNTNREGETIGLARCLSKKLIIELSYNPWAENLNKGLDLSMQTKIQKLGNITKSKFYIIDRNAFACDIKGGFNITNINNYNTNNLKYIEILPNFYNDILKNNSFSQKLELSIIIPTFNNTKYINECINSVSTSIANYSVEVLIGIDGCQQTLSHLQSTTLPPNTKVYYFSENEGPYSIKNTLAKISNSDKLLFFDSDDIMNPNMVEVIINELDRYTCVKPKFEEFGDKSLGSTNFGEGVFGVKKNVFLTMNGFEPWMMAADSDFMGRLYKTKPKILHTPKILFKRRVHQDSLTNRKDTGMRSPLRVHFAKISKNKKGHGNPDKLNTREYILVTKSTPLEIIKPSDPPKEKNSVLKILDRPQVVIPEKEVKEINYEDVNKVIYNKQTNKKNLGQGVNNQSAKTLNVKKKIFQNIKGGNFKI